MKTEHCWASAPGGDSMMTLFWISCRFHPLGRANVKPDDLSRAGGSCRGRAARSASSTSLILPSFEMGLPRIRQSLGSTKNQVPSTKYQETGDKRQETGR